VVKFLAPQVRTVARSVGVTAVASLRVTIAEAPYTQRLFRLNLDAAQRRETLSMATQEMIVEESQHGIPWGSYGVTYARVQGGAVIDEAGYDRDVSYEYVTRLRLQPNEVAFAVCNSSPGGCTVFGSAETRDAYHEHLARQQKLAREEFLDQRDRLIEDACKSARSQQVAVVFDVADDGVVTGLINVSTRVAVRKARVTWRELDAAATQSDDELKAQYARLLADARKLKRAC
jgi:hypothetical protein